MSIGSRARWFLLFSALGLGLPTVTGCKDKDKKEDADKDKDEGASKKGKGKGKKGGDDDKADDDDKGKGKKDKGAKKGDDDDKGGGDKGEAVSYEKLSVLKYAPSKCDGGYMFFGIDNLLKNEAVSSNMDLLQEKIAGTMKGDDGKKAGAAMKELKKGGFDLAKDLKEIAFCAPKEFNDPIVLIGGNFSGKDPLGLINKVAEAGGDEAMKKDKADGVSFLKLKKGAVMASVAPNILAVGESKDDVLALAKAPNGGSSWGVDPGEIFVFKMNEKKDVTVEATITEKGENLDFKVEMSSDDFSKAKPADLKKELKTGLDGVASKMEKGPLKKLADDIKAVKIDVDGKKVTFTVSIPSAHVGEIIKAAANADPADLKKALK